MPRAHHDVPHVLPARNAEDRAGTRTHAENPLHRRPTSALRPHHRHRPPHLRRHHHGHPGTYPPPPPHEGEGLRYAPAGGNLLKNGKRKTENGKLRVSESRVNDFHFKVMPPHFGGMTLSHLSRQVSLGALVRGVGEHGGGIAIFHQFAQVHEHGLG